MSEASGTQMRATTSTFLAFETSDPRADERRRRIRVEAGRVIIARRLAGMRMMLTVPTESYRGVSLAYRPLAEADRFGLRLEHHDPDLSVPLCQTNSFDDMLAAWSDWTQFFELPRLFETDEGFVDLDEARDRPSVFRVAPDRRGSHSVGARRPRFLARRK